MTIDRHMEDPAVPPRPPRPISMPSAGPQGQPGALRPARLSILPVVLSALALAAIFAATHLLPIPGGKKSVTAAITEGRLFDQSPSFDPAEVLARIDGFGEQGRAVYRVMMYSGDFAFPLAILALFLLTTRHLRLTGRPKRLPQVAAGLAVGFFCADMAENAIIFHLLGVFPETSATASVLGIVTTVKFALLAGAVLALALSAVGGAVRRT